MPRKKAKSQANTHSAAGARAKANSPARPAPPTVPGRWILGAVAGVVAAAAVCVWLVLCLLFWQGNWQLLYHPVSTVAQTPASAGLAFDPIGFAVTADGVPQLSGWWIPAAPGSRHSRHTVLYLHGQDGNLGDTISALAQLHQAGVNVFAFDYRGYGQSKPAHPSEAHWLEDAGWALDYLTETRHIDPHSIVVHGKDLGANLALEFADAHHELAGVMVDSPLTDATRPIFADGRARTVPAHLLVRDRYRLLPAAAGLTIPSLWFLPSQTNAAAGSTSIDTAAFEHTPSRKMFVWLPPGQPSNARFAEAFTRWLDELSADR
jgi:hypothetical protein